MINLDSTTRTSYHAHKKETLASEHLDPLTEKEEQELVEQTNGPQPTYSFMRGV